MKITKLVITGITASLALGITAYAEEGDKKGKDHKAKSAKHEEMKKMENSAKLRKRLPRQRSRLNAKPSKPLFLKNSMQMVTASLVRQNVKESVSGSKPTTRMQLWDLKRVKMQKVKEAEKVESAMVAVMLNTSF